MTGTLTNDTILTMAASALIGRKIVRTFFWSEAHGEIVGLEARSHRLVGNIVWCMIRFEDGHEEYIQLKTIQQTTPGSHGVYLLQE